MEFTLKDLLIDGLISKHELNNLAAQVFNGSPLTGVDGYVVTVPVFDDLDKRLQGYIVKALLEAPAVNILSANTPPVDSLDYLDKDGKVVMFPDAEADDHGVNDRVSDPDFDPDDDPDTPLVA